MITARIISILIGYFAGLFQTGVIYGKITGTDLRKTGSGNTGTTNSIRVLGWKAGVIVCAGDLFKAVVAIIVVWLLFRHGEGPVKLYMLYAGLGAVLGHDFPFYLKFKGGKGIATTVGVICACNPLMVPICAACFFAAVIPTGFMSRVPCNVSWLSCSDDPVWRSGAGKSSGHTGSLSCRILYHCCHNHWTGIYPASAKYQPSDPRAGEQIPSRKKITDFRFNQFYM